MLLTPVSFLKAMRKQNGLVDKRKYLHLLENLNKLVRAEGGVGGFQNFVDQVLFCQGKGSIVRVSDKAVFGDAAILLGSGRCPQNFNHLLGLDCLLFILKLIDFFEHRIIAIIVRFNICMIAPWAKSLRICSLILEKGVCGEDTIPADRGYEHGITCLSPV